MIYKSCKKLTEYYEECETFTNNYTENVGGISEWHSGGNVIFGDPEDPPPIEILADAIVHFRPMKNWKGANYGFDWLRIADTKIFAGFLGGNLFGDSKYSDIVGVYDKYPSFNTDAVFTKNLNMFNSLKLGYGNYIVPWLKDDNIPVKYFPSWLSVFKDKEITLSLNTYIKDKKALPKSLVIAYDKEYFEMSSSLGIGNKDDNAEVSINPNMHYVKIPIKEDTHYGLIDEVKLKCIKTISESYKSIRVIADGKEAGYLKVMPNVVKTLNVVCVELKANIGNSTNEGVAKGKLELKKYLAQSLIKTEIVDCKLNILKNVDNTINTKLQTPSVVNTGDIRVDGIVIHNGVRMTILDYLDAELK
jgi:hypothetical protein